MNDVVLDTTIASMMLNQNPLLALYYVHLLNATWLISFQTVAEMRFGALKAEWERPSAEAKSGSGAHRMYVLKYASILVSVALKPSPTSSRSDDPMPPNTFL